MKAFLYMHTAPLNSRQLQCFVTRFLEDVRWKLYHQVKLRFCSMDIAGRGSHACPGSHYSTLDIHKINKIKKWDYFLTSLVSCGILIKPQMQTWL